MISVTLRTHGRTHTHPQLYDRFNDEIDPPLIGLFLASFFFVTLINWTQLMLPILELQYQLEHLMSKVKIHSEEQSGELRRGGGWWNEGGKGE